MFVGNPRNSFEKKHGVTFKIKMYQNNWYTIVENKTT